MGETIMKRDPKTGATAGLFPMEHISINQADGYVDVDGQLDLAHGCVIIADVVADVVVDTVVDVVVDAVVDGAVEVVSDAVVDVAADVVADAAVDAAADAAASGLSQTAINRLKNLGLLLAGAVLGQIVAEATTLVKGVIAGSTTADPATAAKYWTALYNEMVKAYPCDLPASQSCPDQVRAKQQALVLEFALRIAKADPTQATQAQAFQTAFPASSQVALKKALSNISDTAGIPSMVKYLETYTFPNVSGGALVIATSNTLISVADFVFTG